MTAHGKSDWDDRVLPFQLDRADIRGRVARLDGVLGRILSQHDYPAAVEAVLAEALVLTALIGQTIEQRWKLSLQIRGDGPLRLIATDYFAARAPGEAARLRGYASFDAEGLTRARGTPFDAIGRGMFAMLIDQGSGSTPYQGITPLAGGSLAACAAGYFARSEQLPTRFALALGRSSSPGGAEGWRAGGVMIQHMPKASPHVAAGDNAGPPESADDEAWSRVNLHLDTVEELELIGPHVAATDLLYRLFHEETPRVFASQPVAFGCTCGPEKVVQTMSIYSARDIAHMTTPEGRVTADCQFCGAHYEFDPEELGFEATRPPGS